MRPAYNNQSKIVNTRRMQRFSGMPGINNSNINLIFMVL
ncbi:hypothetical protein D1BOALGB6SA_802 [Olavius sp. associated proteobacterium Delta 1]|nr:hypothetical protein D1BOALGB6SA_802 [Olavius sp. associated proteobacterium Delta 1]